MSKKNIIVTNNKKVYRLLNDLKVNNNVSIDLKTYNKLKRIINKINNNGSNYKKNVLQEEFFYDKVNIKKLDKLNASFYYYKK